MGELLLQHELTPIRRISKELAIMTGNNDGGFRCLERLCQFVDEGRREVVGGFIKEEHMWS